MGKDEIINYVTNTPGNANPQVLGMMLDNFNSGSGGSDSVIIYNGVFDGDSIIVDGVTFKDVYDNSDKLQAIICVDESEDKDSGLTETNKYIYNIIFISFNESSSTYSAKITYDDQTYEGSGTGTDEFTLTLLE